MASNAMAGPLPTAATRTPAAVGPMIRVAFRAEPSSALAFCSCPGATNSGTTPRRAGVVNAASAPLANSSPAISGSE